MNSRKSTKFVGMLACAAIWFGCIKDEVTPMTAPCETGETRLADDGCNQCECDDLSQWVCTERDCDARACDEAECGPRPLVPDMACADGTSAGVGDCVRSANGICGWERIECPPECEPGDEVRHFDGNACICNGGGVYECICEGAAPRNDCECLSNGTWACPGEVEECADEEVCIPFFDTCNCQWDCGTGMNSGGDCEIACDDPGPAPECTCDDGECRVLSEPPPEPRCGDPNGECASYFDSCACQWICTDQDLSDRPQCDQVCENENAPPSAECVCAETGCAFTSSTCDEGAERPNIDDCGLCVCQNGQWICPALDDCDPVQCADGDTRPSDDGCNTCTCIDGSWACTERACVNECEVGESRTSEDGCNLCTCQNGQWQCTDRDCPPNVCVEGDVRDADDGCNRCNCLDGSWVCTLRACPPRCSEMACGDRPTLACPSGEPVEFVCEPNENGECVWQQTTSCDDQCRQDSDCNVSGCNGEVCAPFLVNSTCDALPEYACYQDPAVTSCGCFSGRCGWTNESMLNMCLEEARNR